MKYLQEINLFGGKGCVLSQNTHTHAQRQESALVPEVLWRPHNAPYNVTGDKQLKL